MFPTKLQLGSQVILLFGIFPEKLRSWDFDILNFRLIYLGI